MCLPSRFQGNQPVNIPTHSLVPLAVHPKPVDFASTPHPKHLVFSRLSLSFRVCLLPSTTQPSYKTPPPTASLTAPRHPSSEALGAQLLLRLREGRASAARVALPEEVPCAPRDSAESPLPGGFGGVGGNVPDRSSGAKKPLKDLRDVWRYPQST